MPVFRVLWVLSFYSSSRLLFLFFFCNVIFLPFLCLLVLSLEHLCVCILHTHYGPLHLSPKRNYTFNCLDWFFFLLSSLFRLLLFLSVRFLTVCVCVCVCLFVVCSSLSMLLFYIDTTRLLFERKQTRKRKTDYRIDRFKHMYNML
jgi:hypothetical protein